MLAFSTNSPTVLPLSYCFFDAKIMSCLQIAKRSRIFAAKKNIEMSHIDTHKHLVPLFQTLLWGVGIYSCSWDWCLLSVTAEFGSTLQGMAVVYLIFMGECVVSLWDVAYCYKSETFNVHILYWLMCFVLNVLLTLLLCILFFKFEEYHCLTGTFTCLSMASLKFLCAYFVNNTGRYLRQIHIKTYVSTF